MSRFLEQEKIEYMLTRLGKTDKVTTIAGLLPTFFKRLSYKIKTCWFRIRFARASSLDRFQKSSLMYVYPLGVSVNSRTKRNAYAI
jgi:hypothetical protein